MWAALARARSVVTYFEFIKLRILFSIWNTTIRSRGSDIASNKTLSRSAVLLNLGLPTASELLTLVVTLVLDAKLMGVLSSSLTGGFFSF